MNREQFYNKLWKLDISPTELTQFLNNVLSKEEDSLKYIDHVRKFFVKKELNSSPLKSFNLNFFRTLLSCLHTYRSSGGYDPNPVIFHGFMPRPSKEAIAMAEWFSAQKAREQRLKSNKRRGFYRKGERTSDCGTDLQEYLLFYEYKTKGEKA